MIYPDVPLNFTPVYGMKIVATPLSRELTDSNSADIFKTGFLTMD